MNAPRASRSSRVVLVAGLLALSGAAVPAQRIQYEAVGTRAMVTSAHSLATQAGIEILRKGGNAFDAAVAVAAVLNVVEPSRSGMGGVGFMTLYVAKTGEVVSLQMTGAAPYAATPDKFKSKRDQEAGVLAGVVPGNFGGWVYLLEKYGTLPLSDVFAAAIEYADQGFPVDSYLGETLGDARSNLEIFPTTAAVFVPGGALPKAGERLVQKDLATTFRRILAAEAGARKAGKTRGQALMAAYDFFYKGELAQEFAAFYKENDGLFTLKDFADYQPVWAKPIRTTYKEYEVYSNGPTSRGGIQTLMNLNLLESYDLKAMGLNSAEYIHLLAESIKLVNADVYRYVADPKVATVPVDGLLSKAYAAERRKLIKLDQASPYAAAGNPAASATPGVSATGSTPAPGHGAPAPDTSVSSYEDDPNTTHFDIVDAAGNAVAMHADNRHLRHESRRGQDRRHLPQRHQVRVLLAVQGRCELHRGREDAAHQQLAAHRAEEREALHDLGHARRRGHRSDADAGVPERRRVRHGHPGGDRGDAHRVAGEARLLQARRRGQHRIRVTAARSGPQGAPGEGEPASRRARAVRAGVRGDAGDSGEPGAPDDDRRGGPAAGRVRAGVLTLIGIRGSGVRDSGRHRKGQRR